MDYKFLDKVVEQIVSETEIDYDRKVIGNPFPFPIVFYPHFSRSSRLIPFSFFNHCRDVYGLNDDEAYYAWKKYAKILSRSNYFWFW